MSFTRVLQHISLTLCTLAVPLPSESIQTKVLDFRTANGKSVAILLLDQLLCFADNAKVLEMIFFPMGNVVIRGVFYPKYVFLCGWVGVTVRMCLWGGDVSMECMHLILCESSNMESSASVPEDVVHVYTPTPHPCVSVSLQFDSHCCHCVCLCRGIAPRYRCVE